MNDIFCPYCGDELVDEEEIEIQEAYYKEHGICSHWDESKKLSEF